MSEGCEEAIWLMIPVMPSDLAISYAQGDHPADRISAPELFADEFCILYCSLIR